MRKDIIIEGLHMELTEDLKGFVAEKAQKLFTHENRIIRLRIDLEHKANQKRGKQESQCAKGTIEIDKMPLNVSVASDNIFKSIDLLISKLDRKLRRRSRLIKVKRHRLHSVDIPANLPKIQAA